MQPIPDQTSTKEMRVYSVYDSDMTNEMAPETASASTNQAKTGDDTARLAVPKSWEPQAQMALPTLDSINLDKLSPEECKLQCQAILGNIQSAFRQIREQAHVVRARVVDDGRQGHSATMARPACEDDTHARSRALEAISNWHYVDGQRENETSLYMGAVSASASTINAVVELNRLKAAFSHWLQILKEVLGENTGKEEMAKLYAVLVPEAPLNVRRKVAGNMVRELLHHRLNIRQLTRQIPVVPVTPDKISWRWSTTPSTLKIRKGDLVDLLEQRGDAESRYDLQTLANEPGETFSWHKGETEDCRISVYCATAYSQQDPKNPILKNKSIPIKSRLPVFYLSTEPRSTSKRPAFKIAPDDAVKRLRATKTEREPFLISLPIHRYLASE